jgi:hypothetical protein
LPVERKNHIETAQNTNTPPTGQADIPLDSYLIPYDDTIAACYKLSMPHNIFGNASDLP